MRVASAAIVLLVGCSSSTPDSTASSDAIPDATPEVATDARDATGELATDASARCEVPAGANALAGTLDRAPVPQPGSVFLVRRSTAPSNPRILFVAASVECADIAKAGWEGRITPLPSSMILYLELPESATGSFVAARDRPPRAGHAYVAHTYSFAPPNPEPPEQYSTEGIVTVDASDSTGMRGTFSVAFITDPPATDTVCGRFDAKPCDVEW